MTLTATIFYDIPQLNLGLVLHQHKDIHLAAEAAAAAEAAEAAEAENGTTVDEQQQPQSEANNTMRKHLLSASRDASRSGVERNGGRSKSSKTENGKSNEDS